MTQEHPENAPPRRAHRRTRPLPGPPLAPAAEPAKPPSTAPSNLPPASPSPPPPAPGSRGAVQRHQTSIEARRRRVAELLRAGYAQHEILEALLEANKAGRGAEYPGVSKSNIHRDVDALTREWREGASRDVAAWKEQHLADLVLDIENWRRKAVLAADLDDGLRIMRDAILPLMKHRAEILGLKAPTRVDIGDFIARWARDAGYPEARALELAREIAAAAWREA